MAAALKGAFQASCRRQDSRAKQGTLDTDGYVAQVEAGYALQAHGNHNEVSEGASYSNCGVSGLEHFGERPVPRSTCDALDASKTAVSSHNAGIEFMEGSASAEEACYNCLMALL